MAYPVKWCSRANSESKPSGSAKSPRARCSASTEASERPSFVSMFSEMPTFMLASQPRRDRGSVGTNCRPSRAGSPRPQETPGVENVYTCGVALRGPTPSREFRRAARLACILPGTHRLRSFGVWSCSGTLTGGQCMPTSFQRFARGVLLTGVALLIASGLRTAQADVIINNNVGATGTSNFTQSESSFLVLGSTVFG